MKMHNKTLMIVDRERDDVYTIPSEDRQEWETLLFRPDVAESIITLYEMYEEEDVIELLAAAARGGRVTIIFDDMEIRPIRYKECRDLRDLQR